MNALPRLIALLSYPAAIELSALGWRLQGLALAVILGVAGLALIVWAGDWEVRQIIRRQNAEKMAEAVVSEPEDLTEASLERVVAEMRASGKKIIFHPNYITYYEDGRVVFREVPDSDIYLP